MRIVQALLQLQFGGLLMCPLRHQLPWDSLDEILVPGNDKVANDRQKDFQLKAMHHNRLCMRVIHPFYSATTTQNYIFA